MVSVPSSFGDDDDGFTCEIDPPPPFRTTKGRRSTVGGSSAVASSAVVRLQDFGNRSSELCDCKLIALMQRKLALFGTYAWIVRHNPCISNHQTCYQPSKLSCRSRSPLSHPPISQGRERVDRLKDPGSALAPSDSF